MIFVIERASVWGDRCPCEEAEKRIVEYIDSRNFKSFKEYAEALKEDFRNVGFNHKEIDGHIERTLYRNLWTIEINTFEELLSFMDKYGNIVIKKEKGLEHRTIVIYDDYIE